MPSGLGITGLVECKVISVTVGVLAASEIYVKLFVIHLMTRAFAYVKQHDVEWQSD